MMERREMLREDRPVLINRREDAATLARRLLLDVGVQEKGLPRPFYQLGPLSRFPGCRWLRFLGRDEDVRNLLRLGRRRRWWWRRQMLLRLRLGRQVLLLRLRRAMDGMSGMSLRLRRRGHVLRR